MDYNPKQLMADIAAWSEAKTSYETAYNNAVTYDDRGAMEFNKEMVAYSQRRIDELEDQLNKLKKGA